MNTLYHENLELYGNENCGRFAVSDAGCKFLRHAMVLCIRMAQALAI